MRRLESPTRSLEARATQEIFIQSRAGGIETTCLNDLKLHSVAGSVSIPFWRGGGGISFRFDSTTVPKSTKFKCITYERLILCNSRTPIQLTYHNIIYKNCGEFIDSFNEMFS